MAGRWGIGRPWDGEDAGEPLGGDYTPPARDPRAKDNPGQVARRKKETIQRAADITREYLRTLRDIRPKPGYKPPARAFDRLATSLGPEADQGQGVYPGKDRLRWAVGVLKKEFGTLALANHLRANGFSEDEIHDLVGWGKREPGANDTWDDVTTELELGRMKPKGYDERYALATRLSTLLEGTWDDFKQKHGMDAARRWRTRI
jgi:hypothetical protein